MKARSIAAVLAALVARAALADAPVNAAARERERDRRAIYTVVRASIGTVAVALEQSVRDSLPSDAPVEPELARAFDRAVASREPLPPLPDEPAAHRLLLSPIGFSRDGKRALVHAEYLGLHSGFGEFVVLVRAGDRWKIVWSVQASSWIE